MRHEKMSNDEIQAMQDIIGEDNIASVVGALEGGDTDVYTDDNTFRIIHYSVIDEIMGEELSSKEYVLGRFNSSVLAKATKLPYLLFEKLHDIEALEAIRMIVNGIPGAINTLVNERIKEGGYGHHFALYDGEEHEVGSAYYIFRRC